MVLNGVVFRGQAESIPPDGVKHIISLHAPLARYDIQSGIRAGVSYVQALARRIWKFYQCIIFRLFRVIFSMEHACLFPGILPLFLDRLMVVTLAFHS